MNREAAERPSPRQARATALRAGSERPADPVALESYKAHPLLDPFLPSNHPSEARRWLAAYRAVVRDPGEGPRLTRAFVNPIVGDEQGPQEGVESYFQDADQYLEDLLCLASAADRERLRPRPETLQLLDFRVLLRTVFEAPRPRTRYEAQRKLYLTKLLFDVDHCRSVRDGPRHRAMLETLLQRSLWSLEQRVHEVVCRLEEDGRSASRAGAVTSPGAAGGWRFVVRRLAFPDGSDIDVYHHHIRFKRDPVPAGENLADGTAGESSGPSCWPASRRRSGSILSKMIRKGIGDPHLISDILGVTFVVGDRGQAYALERRLLLALGGPFRRRDRVDTLSGERDRARLDPGSAAGFRVLKQVVDILVEDRSAGAPYLFPVEIQIFPFGDYLLTLGGADRAGHDAYKRRQFATKLLPILFPSAIFGTGYERA